jgi:hypothetical protein
MVCLDIFVSHARSSVTCRIIREGGIDDICRTDDKHLVSGLGQGKAHSTSSNRQI